MCEKEMEVLNYNNRNFGQLVDKNLEKFFRIL